MKTYLHQLKHSAVLLLLLCNINLSAQNSKIYGMTSYGGTFNKGVLFELDPSNNTYIKKLEFNGEEKGSFPDGTLVQANDGNLYGITPQGGISNYGVIFKWNLNENAYTKLLDFNGLETGSYPVGSLFLADNGKLYGMTFTGITDTCGVIFELDTSTNNFIKKINFNNTNGAWPLGSLIQTYNGKLYGTTTRGGTNNNYYGVLFEWETYSDTLTLKHNFNSSPTGNLTLANNGKLYGLTNTNGTQIGDILFEWDPSTDTFVKKYDFNVNINGRFPEAHLVQADNGKLYGVTSEGGVNDLGVLFEWDPVNDTYTKKLDFNGTMNGSHPQGALIQSVNGKLYGMTTWGGVNGIGVLFEWDPLTDIYTKKLDFNGEINGSYPCGALIEIIIDSTSSAVETYKDNLTQPIAFPNPTSGLFSINLGKVCSNVFFTISTIEGEIIQQDNTKDLQYINLNLNTSTGIYVVTITSDNERSVFKVVKN